MSTLYNLEPQPTAKAILHTTSGDISLELFAQQIPIASRNFLQLCLDGYYDNTIFHRLVPGFVIQGGDPTGTGSGGESSLEGGLPFEDEFHSRLKFNRRGLLGMANSGTKNDNGSQFFLTLGKTEELTGRNTMFGRVEGNTIFNLVKMGEADLAEGEGSERPLYPTMITGTEVLVNPFADMVKRARTATTQTQEPRVKKKPGVKKKAAKTLLSFGGEEGEEDTSGPIIKTARFNPKLVSAGDVHTTQPTRPTKPIERAPKRHLTRSPSPQSARPKKRTAAAVPTPASPRRSTASPTPSRSPSPPQNTNTNALATTLASIAALKSSLKRSVPTAPTNLNKPKSALEAMIPTTATRGRKRKGAVTGASHAPSREEQKALDAFRAFGRKLDEAPPTAAVVVERDAGDGKSGTVDGPVAAVESSTDKNGAGVEEAAADDDEEAHLCDLHFIAHCQSCTNWENPTSLTTTNPSNPTDDTTTTDAASIFSHRLTFAKDRLGKDLKWKQQNESELVVIDPREKEREIVGEKKRSARAREDKIRERGGGGGAASRGRGMLGGR